MPEGTLRSGSIKRVIGQDRRFEYQSELTGAQ